MSALRAQQLGSYPALLKTTSRPPPELAAGGLQRQSLGLRVAVPALELGGPHAACIGRVSARLKLPDVDS